MSSEKSSILSKTPVLVTIGGILLLYLLALRTGAAFVYFGLVSPDTCWLLKLGSMIAHSGAIPKSDPFSFTIPLYASMGEQQPYVVYQWLSEVAFFYGYSLSPDFTRLLVGAAVLIAVAYLVMPLRACVKLNAPPIWSFLTVAAASTAANVRSFIRPEIFSCFFISLWFWLLLPLRARATAEQEDGVGNGVDWKIVCALAIVMIFWCNMHSGFVSGIIVLIIYAVSSWGEDRYKRSTLSGRTKTLWCSLVASLIASLINPYGVGLWLYLPHLFFTPINEGVRELHPISGTELFEALRLPLFCLAVLCYGAIAWTIFRERNESADFLRSPLRFSNLFMVLVATILCFTKRRLVSLCSIIMLFETVHFISNKKKETGWPPLFWQKGISILVVELMIVGLAPKGVYDLANRLIAVSIPPSTADFAPPLKGMFFFNKNYDGGRIFSSMPIADMLDLYHSPKNSIFMDSRLDAYNLKIFADFNTIYGAERNWKELLDRYEVKWVFVGPNVEVGKRLAKEPGWKLRYKDTASLIFERKQQ
jgi:hypothetical protein